MEPRRRPRAAAVLLAAALAAGGCLRAHEARVGAVPDEPAREAPAAEAPRSGADPPAPAPAAAAAAAPTAPATGQFTVVDFATRVQPILTARCQPCHFPGGKMYEKLPFDDPATIRHLGERLFTRIDTAEEQAVIRAFLIQSPAAEAAPAGHQK